jgi:3'-phosphoadenosine 5'-phosphosulfate sulfotransferase (PAPS reductase)/FAD synthetase
MGKDSNVLIWLALKSFFGKIPLPLLHIDTTYEFPEMLEFRDWAKGALQARPHCEDQLGGARAWHRV